MPVRFAFSSPLRALALCPVLMLAACSGPQSGRPPSGDATGGAASGGDAAKAVDVDAEAKAYYRQLLAQYGQDYEACGPSERTLPEECATAGDIPAAGPADNNILLMLDASGSMAARIGGETKMQAAQDALAAFTGKLPAAANVALRVYGHTGNNQESGKAASCAGTELLYPFQKADAGKFATAIRSFSPTGWTPIAASLNAAARDFAQAPSHDGANVVYVVSDGIETCGGDPVEAARRLHESAIAVVVNVIGFDVDTEAARQLQAVAGAGGGEYLTANSRADLNRIFSQRLNEANKRYSCVLKQQTSAYSHTLNAQTSRYSCLLNKASSEYSAILNRASSEYGSILNAETSRYNTLANRLSAEGPADPDRRRRLLDEARARRNAAVELAKAKRDYAVEQARDKRDGIIDPARDERNRTTDAARETRNTTIDAERAARDARVEQARRERDADQRP